MSAARLLERLNRVRQMHPGNWKACCPAHDDRSPSLSIRELDDGFVLVNCFAGCGPDDVLAAVGMQMRDLFPRCMSAHSHPGARFKVPAADLIVILDHEIMTAALLLEQVLAKRSATEAEMQRLRRCAANLGKARDLVAPFRVKSSAG